MTTNYSMWTETNKDADGKIISYKYRKRYEDPLTGKIKSVSANIKKNTKKAEQEMLQLLNNKINKNLNTLNFKGTFKEVADDWLSIYAHTVKASTLTRNTTNLNALNYALGDYQFDKLTQAHFNDFFQTNLQNGRYKYNTMKQIRSIITRIIQYAFEFKGVNKTAIIPLLNVPKINLTPKDDFKYLERNELRTVLNYFDETDEPEFKRLVRLQVGTGMLYGEMVSLTFDDINLDDYSIDINKTYDFNNKIFTTPKTGDLRTIYINADLINVIKEQMNHARKHTLFYNFNRDNKQLFNSVHGTPIHNRAMNKRLARIDIGKHITSHIFRHTFITLAIEAGMSKDLIVRQVGHADTTMIDKVYAHFTKDMQEQQKKAMLNFKIV